MAAILMWNIWQNRNDVVWNGKSKPVVLIFSFAMSVHSQWVASRNSQIPRLPHPIQQQITHWQCPPAPLIKCNVDAALFNNPPRMGYGGIIRDHRGMVVGAIHGCIPRIQNPAIAEALGIREALSRLKEFDYHHIQIESDAKIVINALNSSIHLGHFN
ncbi:uncharacterized protein [Henckelia pumila]|uniref:uncharacterized protein n=1 Tax=Henckelia pumila TaxID=405737 RepID=UPI003C6DCDB3